LHPYLFLREGKRVIDQALATDKFDIIWVTVPPAIALDLARYASLLSGVPLVADFRDVYQWVPNLFVRVTMPLRVFHERRMLKTATAVTAVSEGFANTLRRRHKRAIETVLHGFDDEMWPKEGVIYTDRFNLVYTGGIVLGKPDLRPLITAVANLIDRGEMDESDISIEFYGEGNHQHIKALLDGQKYCHLVKDYGAVSHDRLMYVQRNASILLMCSHPGIPGWITSKIYEYIIAQRPILSIPKDSDCVDELFWKTKCGTSCSSVVDIEQQLMIWYREWKHSGAIGYTVDKDAIAQYSVLRQAEKLAQLFEAQMEKVVKKPINALSGDLTKQPISVSVVIPVRNGIATIDRAIASVLKQVEVGEIEILVIDDGSTDGTTSFVSDKYPFIRLIPNAGKGVSSARNTGIAHSEGLYVAFLDADDEWKSGKLATQVCFLERNPQYVLSACAAEYVDVDGTLLGIGKKEFDGIATKLLLTSNIIVTSSVVVRKSILRQENLWFHEGMSYAEDMEMWIRLSARGKFNVISTPFTKYTCYLGQKKYELDFIISSLQKMVDSLNSDKKLADTIASSHQIINSIPALARLSWIKEMEGTRAAAFEAIKTLRKYPTRVIKVLRILVLSSY